MFSACFVICVSFGLIQTAPFDDKDPFFPNYDNVNYNEMVRETRNLISKLGPESLLLKSLKARSNSNDASMYREGNDFIRLPNLSSDGSAMWDTLPQSSYLEHGVQAALPLEYGLIAQNVPTPIMWNNKYMQTPYETDQETYEAERALDIGSVNLEVDPYEVDLYPFVHTSVSAALNPMPPVHSLPPVYATLVHESMPSLETRGDYDIDVLNPENSELFPPNLRITRSRRDFMEDLEHDRIMNNIVPTISVPFIRGAENPRSYSEPQTTGQVTALYPSSAYNDCAIPLLLGCSPKILRGIMSNTYAQQVPLEDSQVAYRKEAEKFHKNGFI